MNKILKEKIKHIKGDFDFQELLKGSFKSLMAKILGMAFGFLMVLFISNNYGAEKLGLFSISLTVLNIAVLIPKFGFEQSLVKFLGEININGNKENFYNVLKRTGLISFSLALIFSLAIFFLSDFLAIKVFKNELLINDIKSVSLAVIPTTLLVIISGTYQSLKQTFSHTIFKTGFINIVFTLFLVLNFYVLEKFEEIFIMYAGATYIVFIVGFFTLRKKILSHKLENNKSVEINVKQIVKVSTPMLYSSSFALLIGWVNIILLGYFADESEVGIYDSAGRLAALSSIALIAINSIVAPKFAESFARKNNEELEQVTKKSTKMIFLATTPILVIMVVFGRTALTMFGSEFVVGYWTLVVLCIAKFVGAVSGSVGYLLQMTGRQKVYLNIVAIAFLINLTLGFYLIPKHGYVGAAVATAIAVIFSNLVSIWIIKRRLGFWTFYLPFISK